jgi:hypothetical protein
LRKRSLKKKINILIKKKIKLMKPQIETSWTKLNSKIIQSIWTKMLMKRMIEVL